jgi:hypothetical protein
MRGVRSITFDPQAPGVYRGRRLLSKTRGQPRGMSWTSPDCHAFAAPSICILFDIGLHVQPRAALTRSPTQPLIGPSLDPPKAALNTHSSLTIGRHG